MNITAPTSETSTTKISNSFYTIAYGPKVWTENRTDGVITSIDFLIKGWLKDDVPEASFRNTPPEGSGTPTAIDQAGMVYESFTWAVPEYLQTTETTGLGAENANDDEYDIYYKQWLILIKNTDQYTTKYNSIVSQLEAL